MTPQITIPQNSIGLTIKVSSGGYDMTGLTAQLLLELNQLPGEQPVKIPPLTLTVQSGGMTANYTTVGGEFTGFKPGFYDGALKVFNGSGIELYSLTVANLVLIQPVIG